LADAGADATVVLGNDSAPAYSVGALRQRIAAELNAVDPREVRGLN